MPVYLVGTLDTKGEEIAFARDAIRAWGLETRVIDAGSLNPPRFPPDISRDEVFRLAGTSLEDLATSGDRGEAVAAAALGVARLMAKLRQEGQVDGVLGLGGSAGTLIGTSAMRALPFGCPKVMISTLASGQTRPYVGGSDILMLHSVADLAGLNRLTRAVLTNGANALAGMIQGRQANLPVSQERPLVAATMFGVTTPCVDRARAMLEKSGFEVVVFHATGIGGQSMEGLIRDGQIAGVLDLTTTELADELVGGTLSAGPERLQAAVTAAVPLVVSVGALDMVNFGPRATVPDKFSHRQFHVHNPTVTLMRTTPDENARLGEWMARVLSAVRSPVALMLPLGGVSALDAPGRPFFDPEADRALFSAIQEGLRGHPHVRVDVRDEHVNDPEFAEAAARHLLYLMQSREKSGCQLD